MTKEKDKIRGIRFPEKLWESYMQRAAQNRRTVAAEIIVALEIGLQGNVKIPLKGKIR